MMATITMPRPMIPLVLPISFAGGRTGWVSVGRNFVGLGVGPTVEAVAVIPGVGDITVAVNVAAGVGLPRDAVTEAAGVEVAGPWAIP